MNDNNTWIKLPRNFVNWRWYKETNMVHLYLYLVINANLQPEDFLDIRIKRGEIMISLSRLSQDTNLSVKALRTSLDKLKRTNEIDYRKLKHGRVIIVLNYDKFQPYGIDEAVPDWIKLYRKIEQWKWYSNPKMVHLLVHFLIKAKPVQLGNDFVFQLDTSYTLLNRETGITVQSLRTCIKKMQTDGVITFQPSSTSLLSTITICNYGNYQATRQLRGTTEALHDSNKGTIPVSIEVATEEGQKSTGLFDSTSTYNTDAYEPSKISRGTTRAQEGHDKGTTPVSIEVATEEDQKSTGFFDSTSTYNTDTYEPSKISRGTTRAQKGHDKGTTRAQEGHKKGTTRATIKEYKNIRNKDIKNIINDDDAREEKVFVVEQKEQEEQKENLQKKAGVDFFKEELLSDQVWLSAIAKAFKLHSNVEVAKLLEEFELHLVCRGNEGHKDIRDYKSHFCDWLKFNLTEQTPRKRKSTPNAERWEGEKFVPKSSEGGIYNGPF